MQQLIIILFLLITTLQVSAQSVPSVRENAKHNNAWLMYFGNHKVTSKFGIHAEVQVRRNDFFQNWQQLLLRTGIDFHTAQVRYTLGYGYVETHPYGEFPVAKTFPEHRMWQQALVSNAVGCIKLSHRYRLEQRWIGSSITGKFEDVRYENRFRYMARINIPLQGKSIDPKTFYIGLYDEIFVNFGNQVGYNLFDQNRLYGALGYSLGKLGRIEVGYLHQLVQQRKLLTTVNGLKNIIETNQTIQIALISDLLFYKEKN
jgi:hypothetical protein